MHKPNATNIPPSKRLLCGLHNSTVDLSERERGKETTEYTLSILNKCAQEHRHHESEYTENCKPKMFGVL